MCYNLIVGNSSIYLVCTILYILNILIYSLLHKKLTKCSLTTHKIWNTVSIINIFICFNFLKERYYFHPYSVYFPTTSDILFKYIFIQIINLLIDFHLISFLHKSHLNFQRIFSEALKLNVQIEYFYSISFFLFKKAHDLFEFLVSTAVFFAQLVHEPQEIYTRRRCQAQSPLHRIKKLGGSRKADAWADSEAMQRQIQCLT